MKNTESEEYLAFLKKFETKKTTDDCYTPPRVYDAVADYVAEYYGLDREHFVRPFYPGGDYESYEYGQDAVVVDNPPFSILSKICKYYDLHGVRYFLFAPTLTLFNSNSGKSKYAPVNANIKYENGAKVNTSFVTNLGEYKIDTLPGLYSAITRAQETDDVRLPKYDYPPEVITAARAPLKDMSRLGVSLQIKPEDAVLVRALDSQRQAKKGLYGGGFLLSKKATEAKAKAEAEAKAKAEAEAKAKAEAEAKAKAEAEAQAEKVIIWPLSDREKEIIKNMEV